MRLPDLGKIPTISHFFYLRASLIHKYSKKCPHHGDHCHQRGYGVLLHWWASQSISGSQCSGVGQNIVAQCIRSLYIPHSWSLSWYESPGKQINWGKVGQIQKASPVHPSVVRQRRFLSLQHRFCTEQYRILYYSTVNTPYVVHYTTYCSTVDGFTNDYNVVVIVCDGTMHCPLQWSWWAPSVGITITMSPHTKLPFRAAHFVWSPSGK